MPPSQKGTPFKRKDIAKAFFDLDLSGSGPSTASKTPKPRDRNRLVASKPPATNGAKGNNKVALLTLLIEIRLRIYDRLWVFPEEFLRELAAAQVRHTQKLARELKRVWGIANSAMMS